MRHRPGLPAKRIDRGVHHTGTVAHLIATNSHVYAISATTTFRRDELRFPPALRDRTHRRTRLATTMRSSTPPPDTAGNTAARTIASAAVHWNGRRVDRFVRALHRAPRERLTATTAPVIVANPAGHRQQRSADRHDRRADRPHSRLRVGSHPQVGARTERHIATSGAPTVSLAAMTAPDAEPTGRRRDPNWVAMHQAPPQPAR